MAKKNKKRLANHNPPRVSRVANNKNNELQAVKQTWSGPLPPPNILLEYDEFLPGAADRIIQMAENESSHRHEMEQRVLDADISLSQREYDERRLGQIFGFSISVLAISGGIMMAMWGVASWGAILSLSGVAALAGVFVIGRIKSKKDQ